MRIHAAAYVKAVCHASKHSFGAVNGVLLGLVHEEGNGRQEVEVVDVLPMLHQHTTLNMLAQMALSQADAYARSKDMRIVGYYHASARASSCELSGNGPLIADKIHSKCNGAVALVANFGKLARTGMADCRLFEPFKKGSDGKWKRSDEEIVMLPTEELAYQTAAEFVASGAHEALVDFDDHVADVSRDWLNEDLTRDIKHRFLPTQ
ncbi:hypothetical protein PTSG_02703 [Salpingoeca rosetta]|uniref:MPN domain-containing protein n=1 Tax=Salpingoeca rosetta (strain ATCC 50818 / BSB-021) TaxID=946362 RepID=F2U324_SALR5|nr:uncharacterized protein PTSG_02703 [Salpingoeca rosetta]EGD82018.1 hypothetical protein PTSG_02703 [Salpingoeca rosetta]|eukprot:XP_004996201.1 hypothetical protein PTSG_02703 [Salpingoeca rosetta]